MKRLLCALLLVLLAAPVRAEERRLFDASAYGALALRARRRRERIAQQLGAAASLAASAPAARRHWECHCASARASRSALTPCCLLDLTCSLSSRPPSRCIRGHATCHTQQLWAPVHTVPSYGGSSLTGAEGVCMWVNGGVCAQHLRVRSFVTGVRGRRPGLPLW